jgi:hypothetical protein
MDIGLHLRLRLVERGSHSHDSWKGHALKHRDVLRGDRDQEEPEQ